MDSLAERLKKMTPLQRAVLALKETQARLAALEEKRTEPIAIVGMACRFPGGASDPRSYWRLIRDGVDAIRETPSDRWDVEAFYDPDPLAPGKMNTRWGGFIERIDEFDNHFFGISDREATRIDPQQRILLELAWEALADAGLPPSHLRGSRLGVFVGISVSEYGLMLNSDLAASDAHAATGTSLCLAANRISFALGAQGPSLALDTACSSSLVAIHLACQNIRAGECDAALAGGSSLLLSPVATVNLTKAGFSASDGRVRAFDAAASGYVRGEGAGLVVLKPLSAALKNKDPIYALIRSTAVNQNGVSNGLTAPSRAGQEQVLREAYARAKVSPGDVQYVETQGTGTRLGDAIESLALGNVLREGRAAGNRCAIGSVKTNLGHLESASGVASLMKTALALKHRQLPPSLHFHTPNPDIPFDTLPLRVQQHLEPWPNSAQPRLAGVSAFGFGGSNSHAVLQEAPAADGEQTGAGPACQRCVLPLSARTDSALRDLTERWLDFLGDDPPAWSDVCYTASRRRDHYDCRLAVLADSPQQAAKLLASFAAGQPSNRVLHGRKPFARKLKVAFLFDGRVQAWQPLTSHLTRNVPGFSAAMKDTAAALERVAGWNLEAALSEDARWREPAYAWPMLVALQLATTAWWRSVGVTPDVVVGQGFGELTAACAAGVVALEDALQLAVACARGDGEGGAAGLSSSAENTVGQTNRGARQVNCVDALVQLQLRRASLPCFAARGGNLRPIANLDPSHWQQPSDSDAMAAAMSTRSEDVFLEIGPQSQSGRPITPLSPCARGVGGEGVTPADHEAIVGRPLSESLARLCLPTFAATDGNPADVFTAMAALYAAGADLVWDNVAPADGRCVRLPSYPWQRQRLWMTVKAWPPAPLGANRPTDNVAAANASQSATAEPRNRPEMVAPFVAPRSRMEADIARAWSELLRIDRVGVHDNFFELGGDSLQATILLNHLRESLGVSVAGHTLFQMQTIDDLTSHLIQSCPEAVARLYPEEKIDGAAVAAPQLDGALGIARVARDQGAEQLLARLDDLSDDELESLLEASGDNEARHE